jgi:hypothetical protein
MIASQEALKVRKQEVILLENETKPVLALLMEKTRKLQEQVNCFFTTLTNFLLRPSHRLVLL